MPISETDVKGYTELIVEAHNMIRAIRREAQQQITEVWNYTLAQTEQDFILLGWTKYWTNEQLNTDGQYERVEQSVMDTKLKLIAVDERSQKGIVDDCSASYKVSGAKCSCADFVFRGLPCKHMYFLAGILLQSEKVLLKDQNTYIPSR